MTLVLNLLLPDTIAFHSIVISYDTMPLQSAVQFNEVVLNEGDGYVLQILSCYIFSTYFKARGKIN